HAIALFITFLICVFTIVITFAIVKLNTRNREKSYEAPKNYSGHQVLRVIPKNSYHIRSLKTLREKYKLNFWSATIKINSSILIQVSPNQQTPVRRYLHDSFVPYVIVIFDLQQTIDRQYNDHKRTQVKHHSQFDVSSYHTFDEIIEYLSLLNDHENVNLIVIGNSTENRSLYVAEIKSNKAKDDRSAVFIECGIHAREWISPAACLFIINQLLNDPSLHELREQYVFYILPVLNPDGYEYTWTHDRLWRKTRSKPKGVERIYDSCIGVDLNRNFGYATARAGTHTSNQPCEETYIGMKPFSEPEARALRDFLTRLKANKTHILAMYISLHSYGQVWTYPYAHTIEEPRNKRKLILVT
ncbi:hypothetical protein B4U79_09238, partial [Dinothrombium tinctorium]